MISTLNQQQNIKQFEEIVNELKKIQQKVDYLLIKSVFLKKPISCSNINCINFFNLVKLNYFF